MASVFVSSVIDAPVSKVWALIRDFNSLPAWHPRMIECHIEDSLPSDQVGCVRNFAIVSGARIREKLVALSDRDFSVSYSILEHPTPISNHFATLRLIPVTDGDGCFAQWTASFDCPPDQADALATGMGANVFQAGLSGIKAYFASRS